MTWSRNLVAAAVTAGAAALLAVPGGLAAQSAPVVPGPRAAASAGVSILRSATLDGGIRRTGVGVVGSLEGRVRFEILSLIVGYQQGSLGPSGGRRSFAEGGVAIAASLPEGIELRGGAGAYVLGDGDAIDRWVHWLGAARVERRLEPTALSLTLEGRLGLGTRASAEGQRAQMIGGATGIRWRRADREVRLEYGMEETRLPTNGRLTVERIVLTVGLAR